MVKWRFVIVTLCFCCLPATAIQSTRRLALPIFSEVLPVADPEPVVKNSSSSTAATKTDDDCNLLHHWFVLSFDFAFSRVDCARFL
jgi:hypothetical protein